MQDPLSAQAQASYAVGRHLWFAAGLAVLLLGGVGGWAATARLNAAVVASGLVKVDQELRTVQHPDGGTVAEILVSPGTRVRAGQPIVALDMFEINGQLAILGQQRVELAAKVARLRADLDGRDGLTLPEGILPDAALSAALTEEAQLLARSRAERDSQRAALDSRLGQIDSDQAALQARLAALQGQLDLSKRQTDRLDQLTKSGTTAAARQEEALAAQTRLRGDLDETLARLGAIAPQRAEVRIEQARIDEIARLQAQEGLRDYEPRLAALNEEITLLQRRQERALVRAPVGGVVNELDVNTTGQVVAAGQRIASIVPEGTDLVIEFPVSPADIDQLAVGKAARLRFSAFDQSTTPELAGVVSHVAAAATVDPATGQFQFIAQARPADAAGLPDHVRLVPGMPVEVFVTTAERTALDYLLQPVRKSFARALNEE